MTADDVDIVAARRDPEAGKIQDRSGIAKEDDRQQISTWLRRTDETCLPPRSTKP